ncbi:hypothetical protein EDC27_2744 [Desulfosoma caldarium]|uniref:Uncharacterized protein n=1 Tax=Desulfosoma caldarium TaxID=610254 RepID=A0A3N1UFM7_9BACT|nr:hypothetical protein EDC27_2744 [Desulfosoma caldarium]
MIWRANLMPRPTMEQKGSPWGKEKASLGGLIPIGDLVL